MKVSTENENKYPFKYRYYSYSQTPLYNKSLSIKDSLIFPINDSAYNFNLYIKGNCS